MKPNGHSSSHMTKNPSTIEAQPDVSWSAEVPIREGDLLKISKTKRFPGGKAKEGEIGTACDVYGVFPDQVVTIDMLERPAIIYAERKDLLALHARGLQVPRS